MRLNFVSLISLFVCFGCTSIPFVVPDDDSADDDSACDDDNVVDDDDTVVADDDVSDDDDTSPVDADGDGYADSIDCDDTDPDVYPGATEVCDEIDNDCDEQIDEDVANDSDCDGFTDQPDCDDDDPDVFPGAPEDCDDGIDNDCDGDVDEDDNECEDEDQFLSLALWYPTQHASLVLTVQPVWLVSELGDWWMPNAATSTNDNDVIWGSEDDYFGILGARFNVTVDGASWYCMGHNATAQIDESVVILLMLGSMSWDEDDAVAWSPAGVSPSLGCSGLIWFGPLSGVTEGTITQ